MIILYLNWYCPPHIIIIIIIIIAQAADELRNKSTVDEVLETTRSVQLLL